MNKANIDQRLKEIRHEIDDVDMELLQVLNKRAALSMEVGRIKSGSGETIFKPLREREVLDNLEQNNAGPLPNAHIRTIWREIFSSSRALQRPQKVGYLGPEGTFSYFAGIEYLGKSAEFQPCTNFYDIFSAVHRGECELGVVPLENSLQGTVGQCFDLFYNFEVSIQAELFLRISHSLLSKENSLTNIKRIYSHPQPLTQCDTWLRVNLPMAELIPVESTSAAAHRAAEDKNSAAIGHVALGDMFSLNVLASAIENSTDNWTRFVIISRTDAGINSLLKQGPASETGHKKTSIIFTLIDKPGSLSSILGALAESSVNMRKLESRPLRLSSGECWQYVFFADVEEDLIQEKYTGLVQKMRELCNSFRILGSYPTVPNQIITSAGTANDSGEIC